MKYILILLLMTATTCFAQDYATQIATFRKGYMDDFLKDANSPLKKDDLAQLRFYDADSTYRVTAQATLLPDASTFTMPVFSGTGSQYVKYALLKFTLQGKPMELSVYRSIALSQNPMYSNYLFLPFTDDTNGKETYGGGRYIDLTKNDFKNGTVVIDLNKAYNPYCAFSGNYSCPKPPDENRLPIAVNAGEKLFAGQKAH
ncbi:DUF1684 domain-containing protein [Mucilaginibacter sp. FT3.2]|uniref:DUF1684 domain-containing protein n=1 Tax=Mucilaginibacter sp. FT3.2 TaxID=2723090 RepID=UPI00160E4EFC|nr:DUF1684 domain-containing protein [Mucilaginibacter sp. FT3.2]MBB6235244.1 hypothetical protein [Mucilaginibacter sp. FT3.2]